jgi:hypothetical protein
MAAMPIRKRSRARRLCYVVISATALTNCDWHAAASIEDECVVDVLR